MSMPYCYYENLTNKISGKFQPSCLKIPTLEILFSPANEIKKWCTITSIDKCRQYTIHLPLSGWKWVRNQQAVPINFKKHNLEVKTDSWAIANRRGRFERMRIVFYNTRGMESGGFFVRFSSPLQYMIPWCSQWKTFPDNLPSAWAERKKTWRISKDKKSLVVTSNGVEVVNFTASNETCDKWPNWSYFWEKETVRVKFTKFLDYASDEYRLQLPSSNWDPVPKGVKFNVNSDLRRSPLEISTSSELGSKDEISILFYDEHENPSGGLKISFSKRPRFAIPHCRWYTNFYRASLKKLLEMPQEKVWAVERSPAGIRVQANGEKVLNFALSDTSCRDVKSWSQFWSRSVHKVKFLSTKDTASESCRLVEPPTIPPAWRKDTVSPERGGYDMSPEPPSEAPTKHFRRDTDNCWMDGVQPINTKMILTKAWESEEHCESLCRGTIGCHAIFKKRYDIEARRWLDHERCELFGEYDLARNGTYFHREVLRMAERKCFDPDHYTSENSSNPCGAYSWECKER